MSKEKRRVPKLRFPGFTEDWEQRKLGQFTARVTRKNGGQSDLPLTISAQDGLVDQRKYFNRQVASRDMSNYYLIKKGEFAYNKSYSEGYPFGAVKRLDYYDIGALSTLYILFEITDKNISSDFIVSYYMTHLWYKEISKRAAEGARNHGLLNISTEDFFDSELNIPNSIEEQVKIGNFIKEFDKFITLHQRKLDNLKLKKKALLQKLFPKNGERYPELRFPEFTDAWEQRKLNEFLSVSNLKNTENKYNKKDVLSVSGDYGIVNQIEFQGRSFAGVSVSNYGVVEKGDIVYTKSPLKLNPYGIIKTNRINNGIVSTLYAIYKTKENCDSKFIEHYFNLDSRLNQYLKPLVNKGAKNDMKVSSENALVGEVCFPQITEQAMIADLLDRLDTYITLHQRKLDHLQLQKKALLQQMFV